MKFAISNWIYGDEPLEAQFERLARFGYDGIELVGEPDRYSINQIRMLCQKYKISISSILGWCIWGIPGRDGANPDVDERKKAISYCCQCVDLALASGAPILVVIPAPAGRTSPTGNPTSPEDWLNKYALEWNLAVNSVSEICDYASGKNITIGLEPINRYETFLVTNTDLAERFIKDVGADNLKIHLDTFHMNIEETEIALAIKGAGRKLVNMHVSDSNREAPGRGHIDFTAMVAALQEINYEGYLTLEPIPPGSDPLLMTKMPSNHFLRDVYAEESIEYLKRFVQ